MTLVKCYLGKLPNGGYPDNQGRNPVIFCHEQSKMRGLEMEWEQVLFNSNY
jgi:hypothetical protein